MLMPRTTHPYTRSPCLLWTQLQSSTYRCGQVPCHTILAPLEVFCVPIGTVRGGLTAAWHSGPRRSCLLSAVLVVGPGSAH